MLFRKWGCLVGPKNSIFRKLKYVDRKKKPLTMEIILHFYFPFKVFPENERKRETERARAIAIAPDLVIGSRSRSHWIEGEIAPDEDHRRRDLAKIAISPSRDRTGSRSPSTLREIAPSIAISRRRRDRDRVVDRDRRCDLGCGLCFSEFVFSFFFSKHQKIFSGKFFEMQPNTMETFSFSRN